MSTAQWMDMEHGQRWRILLDGLRIEVSDYRGRWGWMLDGVIGDAPRGASLEQARCHAIEESRKLLTDALAALPPPPVCLPCSECTGRHHAGQHHAHADAVECKHCDAVAAVTPCSGCDGAGCTGCGWSGTQAGEWVRPQ